MQQRYYDQGVGRFLSVDPVSASSINGGNFNRYWYANNNPYKFTDPDGRQVCRKSIGESCALPPPRPAHWGQGGAPDTQLAKGSGNGRTKNDWNLDDFDAKERNVLAGIVAKDEGVVTDGTHFSIGKKGTPKSYVLVNGEVGLADRAFETLNRPAFRRHLEAIVDGNRGGVK